MTATAKKQKPLKRHPSKLKKMSAYMILTLILISIVAVLFAFPLYWIITGSFKTGAAINSTTPEWWPSQWVLTNYQKLFAGKSAPLWQLAVPFSHSFSADGEPIYFSVGPTAPAALRWMINTVFMAVMSMIFTCITAAMAGYALAKKRFVGRKLLFTLIVCAMALPKQVILIPLLREMSALNLYNTISNKWQFLNSYKDGTITADTAGSYLLTNQNLRFANINWTFFIAAGALTVVCLIVYIAVKKRYWYW